MGHVLVYFSHTGNTKRAGEAIAKALNAQVIPLVAQPPIKADGLPMLNILWRTMIGADWGVRAPPMPADGHVILGTPLWGARLHPVVRGWIKANSSLRGRAYSVFITSDADAGAGAIKELTRRLGQAPQATTTITHAERLNGADTRKIEAFVAAVRTKA